MILIITACTYWETCIQKEMNNTYVTPWVPAFQNELCMKMQIILQQRFLTLGAFKKFSILKKNQFLTFFSIEICVTIEMCHNHAISKSFIAIKVILYCILHHKRLTDICVQCLCYLLKLSDSELETFMSILH